MKVSVAGKIAMRALLLIAVMLVAACAHDPYSVVVVDANDVKAAKKVDRYTVKKGDTLYSIAFRYGTTVYALARSNGLKEPYTIFVGQSLLVSSANVARPVAARPAASVKPKASAKPAPPVVKPRPSKTKVSNTPSGNRRWVLPSKGLITKGFSQAKDVHKGIDFKAAKGSAVVAARAGKVVYAGDGLKAYGLLIIIKHDQHYLSAYAYNQRLFVKEGDTVKQGQKIAAVGLKGDQSMLHFEIRKNGKPIDPRRELSLSSK